MPTYSLLLWSRDGRKPQIATLSWKYFPHFSWESLCYIQQSDFFFFSFLEFPVEHKKTCLLPGLVVNQF